MGRTVSRPNVKASILIDTICQKCGAPDKVRTRATTIHNMMIQHGLHKGWPLETRAAAVVSLAFRMEDVPRTSKSICEAAGSKTGQTHNVYSVLVSGLGLNVPPPVPAMFVSSIAVSCNIPEVVRRRAVDILNQYRTSLSGKDPTTLAAAALHIACIDCNHQTTQQCIAEAADVSTVSLRLRRQDLEMIISANPITTL